MEQREYGDINSDAGRSKGGDAEDGDQRHDNRWRK